MTRSEWLDIGFSNGIIDMEDYVEMKFSDAYRIWFLMKMKCIKRQSLDRIEVTYNRYYQSTSFIEKCISKITEKDIIDFLLSVVIQSGSMARKEFSRIYQIVNGTLLYMRDTSQGGARLLDWSAIKRNIPDEKINASVKRDYAVSNVNVSRLIDMVVNHKVYYEKQAACLCLCMNFYLGLRIGELAGLAFRDFDFNRGVVRISRTESKFYERDGTGKKVGSMVYRVTDSLKTVNAVREIPILPEVKYFYDLIREYHASCGYETPYLVYDGREVIRVRSLDTCLRRLCKLCDIEYFNSHEIRKTFATVLHYNGVPTRVISDLMGHSEIKTTEDSYILSYADNYSHVYDLMKQSLIYN